MSVADRSVDQPSEQELLGDRRHDDREHREDDELEALQVPGHLLGHGDLLVRHRGEDRDDDRHRDAGHDAHGDTQPGADRDLTADTRGRDETQGVAPPRVPRPQPYEQRADQHHVDDDPLRDLADTARAPFAGVAERREERGRGERTEHEAEEHDAEGGQEPPGDLRATVGQRRDRGTGRARRADRRPIGAQIGSAGGSGHHRRVPRGGGSPDPRRGEPRPRARAASRRTPRSRGRGGAARRSR